MMTKKYEIVGTAEIYEGYIAEGNLCDYLELEDLCDLLNELSEENRKLKEACKKYGIELKDIPEILDWADSTLQDEYGSRLSEWND